MVTKDGRGTVRKTMIVALARKLLIALWRMVTIATTRGRRIARRLKPKGETFELRKPVTTVSLPAFADGPRWR